MKILMNLNRLRVLISLTEKISFNAGKKLPPNVDANSIFTSNELDLNEVDVYGFDYDYTLACYKESVDHLIYNLGRETLVQKLKVNKLKKFTSFTEFLIQLNIFSILGIFSN